MAPLIICICGTRSRNRAGALDVHKSAGSAKWLSLSMILRSPMIRSTSAGEIETAVIVPSKARPVRPFLNARSRHADCEVHIRDADRDFGPHLSLPYAECGTVWAVDSRRGKGPLPLLGARRLERITLISG